MSRSAGRKPDPAARNPARRAPFRATLLLALVAFAAACQSPPAPPSVATPDTAGEDWLAAFETNVNAVIDAGQFPGFAFAIVDQTGIRWTAGYGLANVETGAPATPDTVYTMGSVSKTFIGTAAAIAWDEGALDLDADINAFLDFTVDNPRTEEGPITFLDLATHTSGIIDAYATYESAYAFGEKRHPTDLHDWLAAYLEPGGEMYDDKLNFIEAAPRQTYNYSNIAAALAAQVIAGATNTSFDEYTSEKIFAPLGMDSTTWFLDDVDMTRFARPYERADNGYQPYDDYALATWPDGGLRTTARDLAQYLAAIIARGAHNDNQWLSPRAYQRLTTAIDLRDTEDLPRTHIQSALFWGGDAGPTVAQRRFFFGHNGSDPGVGTMMYFDPISGRGAIALTNSDLDTRDEIIAFYRLFYQLFELDPPL